MSRRPAIVFASLLACLVWAAWAQQPPASPQPATQPTQPATRPSPPALLVGDPAPPLGQGKWIKGDPVASFEPGKIYVMAFWATWSEPCKRAIPQLADLQKKFADQGVVMIGQNISETDPARVEPYVEEMGQQMDFRVVMDEPPGRDGMMAKAWLVAAGRNEIPCAFVVDQQGRIAWIGHPLGLEPVLQKVIAGTHDIEAARRDVEIERQLLGLQEQVKLAIVLGEVETALGLSEEIARVKPEMASQLPLMQFQILMQSKRPTEAYARADKAIETMNDPLALNTLAWWIVDPESVLPRKNLDVALKAAIKAQELARENPAILDTLARAYFLKGDKQKALELQRQAVEHARNEEHRQRLQKTMREYEQVQ